MHSNQLMRMRVNSDSSTDHGFIQLKTSDAFRERSQSVFQLDSEPGIPFKCKPIDSLLSKVGSVALDETHAHSESSYEWGFIQTESFDVNGKQGQSIHDLISEVSVVMGEQRCESRGSLERLSQTE
jgi:hypothetical protein